ncbi:MAG: tRNA (adenosine(37)-N6)-dimethylallyltransferase MiaA [Bacteroidales bacterium]
MKKFDLITILGPTASGKTALAAQLAHKIGGEIISADSRQVYRGMDIGTGKDLDEYLLDGYKIPHHLVDIAAPGEAYDLYRFVQDFYTAYDQIRSRGKQPIMCGGSGMYLEAVIGGYRLKPAQVNARWRSEWDQMSQGALVEMLKELRPLHNITDIRDRERLYRALEIALSGEGQNIADTKDAGLSLLIIGVDMPRALLRQRITERLNARLEAGLVDEVQNLINRGVAPDKLRYYGLEYRYVTDYITGLTDYPTMVSLLNTAIHQFAKRQMTWFRRMEKKNILIHWVDGNQDVYKKLETILQCLED